MGLLKSLFKLGTTVAATVAAVKVADKISENNPNGVQDKDGDGKVTYKDYASEVKKAAGEVLRDTVGSVKKASPETVDTVKQAAEDIKNGFSGVVDDMRNAFEEKVHPRPDVIEVKPESVEDVPDDLGK